MIPGTMVVLGRRLIARLFMRPRICPMCEGSGQNHLGYGDIRYWQGIAYRVCVHCKGAGIL